jgi:hypothetical protein
MDRAATLTLWVSVAAGFDSPGQQRLDVGERGGLLQFLEDQLGIVVGLQPAGLGRLDDALQFRRGVSAARRPIARKLTLQLRKSRSVRQR